MSDTATIFRLRNALRALIEWNMLPEDIDHLYAQGILEPGDMPAGTVLIDPLGNPWHLIDAEWYTTGIEGPRTLTSSDGPFEVVWLPKEN